MEQKELEDMIKAEVEKREADNPQPQEEKPETKIETETPETKEEPIKEDIKTEQKIEKNIKTIPLSAHIRAEKEYKAKIAELTGELERCRHKQEPARQMDRGIRYLREVDRAADSTALSSDTAETGHFDRCCLPCRCREPCCRKTPEKARPG